MKWFGTRSGGIFLLMLLLVGIAGAVLLVQHQQNLSQHASNNPTTYEMGIYTSCGAKDACLNQLDTLAQGGFTDVLDYGIWNGNPSMKDFTLYATHAQNLGLKIIWNFKDFWNDPHQLIQEYPEMAATCGCSNNTGFLAYVVNSVKNFPATWGYYIADEARVQNHQAVKNVSDLIHTVDPVHPRLYVANAWTVGDVNTILGTYADTADVLATDFYPTGFGQNINDTKKLADAVQQVANSTGKQSAMVLQAHSWNHYTTCGKPYPQTIDMISQMTQTLNYQHPALILWYSYFDLLAQSCPEDNFSLHWGNLQTAIHSITLGACSADGGDSRSYPQCSRTTTGCVQNFPASYLVTVHHCNDGAYICPANEARAANPGECGLPANPAPIGYLDGASCSYVYGWACDASNYQQPLRVDLYVDGPSGVGTNIVQLQANIQRESAVGERCGGNNGHGFYYPLPASLKDGKPHTLYVYAIDTPAGNNNPLLIGSPKTFTCSR